MRRSGSLVTTADGHLWQLVLQDAGGHPLAFFVDLSSVIVGPDPRSATGLAEKTDVSGHGFTAAAHAPPRVAPDLLGDVVAMCSELIRIDTSYPGGAERPAAEYVAERLAEVGIGGDFYEAMPGRTNYVARFEGYGTSSEALVVHCHLDVVPAEPNGWRHHPFSGEFSEGCVWGRGAVDMKGMVAMTLAAVRAMVATGVRPKRDLILAFFADEERGATNGSAFMVAQHPEVFEGATAAVGELGGFSVTLPSGHRLYPIQVAEKGALGVRIKARGRAGHASMPQPDDAITRLAEAVARIGRARLPLRLTATTKDLLAELGTLLGRNLDPCLAEDLDALGLLRTWVEPTLRNTISTTTLSAGNALNVVPGEAEAMLNCRFVPGGESDIEAELDELLGPEMSRETIIAGPGVEAPWDHPLPRAMAEAILLEDPVAHPLPFMIPAATDAKFLSTLGLACYGFAPLLLPPDLDFAALFHGVDERVPVDALEFGGRVLHRLFSESEA